MAALAIAAVVSVAVGVIAISAAVIARHRAQAAADLAALAAAGRLAAGPESACREAAGLATAMKASVTQCTVVDLDVVVRVATRAGQTFGIASEADAVARAGPVSARSR